MSHVAKNCTVSNLNPHIVSLISIRIPNSVSSKFSFSCMLSRLGIQEKV